MVDIPRTLPWELIERIWPKIQSDLVDCYFCGDNPGPHGCSFSDMRIRHYLREHPEEFSMVERNDVNLGGRLPEWQSHKRVRAAKILRIGRGADWPEGSAADIGADTMWLDIPNPDGKTMFAVYVNPKPGMFTRYRPVPGDYYVVYDHDTPEEYHSISPAAAFEKGYALIAGEVG